VGEINRQLPQGGGWEGGGGEGRGGRGELHWALVLVWGVVEIEGGEVEVKRVPHLVDERRAIQGLATGSAGGFVWTLDGNQPEEHNHSGRDRRGQVLDQGSEETGVRLAAISRPRRGLTAKNGEVRWRPMAAGIRVVGEQRENGKGLYRHSLVRWWRLGKRVIPRQFGHLNPNLQIRTGWTRSQICGG